MNAANLANVSHFPGEVGHEDGERDEDWKAEMPVSDVMGASRWTYREEPLAPLLTTGLTPCACLRFP